MGLFSFLFPKNKTVFDFFQINIKEIPDSSFIDEGFQYDKDGGEFRFYTKTLDYLECGIFNEIEVSKYDGSVSVTFRSGSSPTLNIAKLKELVNELCYIYGNDGAGGGKVTSQESQEILDYREFGNFLRFWVTKSLWVRIYTNSDDNDIVLTIFIIDNDFSNNEYKKKTIYELFKTNLKELPDKRFNANGFISSEKVAGFYSFDLTLDYLECGIFNEINVHQHPEGGMTVFFTSANLLNVELEKVKELVDSLFNLYGMDVDDRGKFTDQEKNEFYGHHESSLRTWLDPELPFEMIDISVDRENNEISMTIIVSNAD